MFIGKAAFCCFNTYVSRGFPDPTEVIGDTFRFSVVMEPNPLVFAGLKVAWG
jgi:hypothetical protein